MATAAIPRGDVIETPTQEKPFKGVIYNEGEVVIQERFFVTRAEAEAFVAETLQGLGQAVKFTDDD